VLNLKNAKHQVKLYLNELPQFAEKYHIGDLEEKAQWFKKVFEYYIDQLIPAIQETAEMEKKHLDIFANNPDDIFHPEIEVENHQHLTKQFLHRFEEVHKEFEAFISMVKQNKN